MRPEGTTQDTYQIELRRRLGFEFNGMRLHEYFESLGGDGMANVNSNLYSTSNAIRIVDIWLNEFKAAGMMQALAG